MYHGIFRQGHDALFLLFLQERLNVAVLMPHGLDHWGRYLDRYEEQHGRWLFTQRRALPDGRRDDG